MLRKLDLKFTFLGPGLPGEDVEYERRAVYYAGANFFLEKALLSR